MPILGIVASQLVLESNSFESIESVTVGSGGASSITFGSGGTIPQTYKHLQIRMLSRTNRAYPYDALKLRINGDSSANYAYHELTGTGAGTPSAAGLTGLTYSPTPNMTGDSATSGMYGVTVTDILDYTNTSKNKTIRHLGGLDINGDGRISLESGLWLSTSAVTSITLSPEAGTSFMQYSSFALYGIKG